MFPLITIVHSIWANQTRWSEFNSDTAAFQYYLKTARQLIAHQVAHHIHYDLVGVPPTLRRHTGYQVGPSPGHTYLGHRKRKVIKLGRVFIPSHSPSTLSYFLYVPPAMAAGVAPDQISYFMPYFITTLFRNICIESNFKQGPGPCSSGISCPVWQTVPDGGRLGTESHPIPLPFRSRTLWMM